MKTKPIKLNNYLEILLKIAFILLYFGSFCNVLEQKDFLKEIYHSLIIKDLPWGISPEKLEKKLKNYFINKTNQEIEFVIKEEIKNQNDFPILKDVDSPYIFRFICYYTDNKCVIYKIEKLGTEKEIEKYWENFIKLNNINNNMLKNQNFNEYYSESGNYIKETYNLYETIEYIIQVYITKIHYPEDIKNQKDFTLTENADIDIRIYAKKYNPGINIDFFLKN